MQNTNIRQMKRVSNEGLIKMGDIRYNHVIFDFPTATIVKNTIFLNVM
jgi:hypothetical protein